MEAREVIIRPLVTEKSHRLTEMDKPQYTFEVHPEADKIQIRKAVEELFKVHVLAVNTVRVRGKLRRVGRFQGRLPDRKKAIVTLAKGERIQVFEGA